VSNFKQIRDNGVIFVFKYDVDAPELLHIYARHLMEPGDAIDVWWAGTPTWNNAYRRFENEYEGIGIYWYWIDEAAQVAMIASCFCA
jgi:hypothetical protein